MAMLGETGMSFITNQDKIKYLKRFLALEKEINALHETILGLRESLGKITSDIGVMPKGGGSIYKGNVIDQIDSLEEELREKIAETMKVRAEIVRVIETIEEDTERTLMRRRYIQGETFEKIAVALSYSWRQVHRIHSNALDKIKVS